MKKKQTQHSSRSLLSLMSEQFFSHKLASISLFVIIVFVLIALGAGFIGDVLHIDPHTQNVFHRYEKPGVQIDISKHEKLKKTKIFLSSKTQDETDSLNRWGESLGIENLMTKENVSLFLERLTDESFYESVKENKKLSSFIDLKESFTKTHLLGTDELGRDVLIRLIYGSRVSLGIGLVVALFSALIGLLIGVFAGLSKGLLDQLLMRITDGFLSIPQIPLYIIISAIDLGKVPFLAGLGENESVIKMVLILCLFSWMTPARLVRGEVLTLKQRDFILASQTLGATRLHMLIYHIFPNVLGPLVVAITLIMGQVILTEAALSFLGLGIQPPTPSWGRMLFNAQEIIYEAPYLAIFPGIMISILVVSFSFIGDGLQTAVNPKSLKR